MTSNNQWKMEIEKLREIALDCNLREEFKWGKPCFTYNGSNIVIIQGFKQYLALLFFKGVLMKDPDGILVKTGENTQVGRQIRFQEMNDIVGKEDILKAYILEAVKVEKSGAKVEVPQATETEMPDELQEKFDEVDGLEEAFKDLTPGRQRAYIHYFSSAKQSQTRTSRIEKSMKDIFDGKGLNDR